MKLAVAVPEIAEHDIAVNFQTIQTYIKEAIQSNVDLLLFPEAVLTGLVISGNYDVDKKYAISINSEYIKQIAKLSQTGGIWVALGFIEIDNGILYDSAVLINNTGDIVLHQRRLSEGWCSTAASPKEYGYADKYSTADTPWGKVGFMLCGDLFNVPYYAKNANLDILLFPFARCFGSWL